MATILKPARDLQPGDVMPVLGTVRAVKKFWTTVDVEFTSRQRRTYLAGLLVDVRRAP